MTLSSCFKQLLTDGFGLIKPKCKDTDFVERKYFNVKKKVGNKNPLLMRMA